MDIHDGGSVMISVVSVCMGGGDLIEMNSRQNVRLRFDDN